MQSATSRELERYRGDASVGSGLRPGTSGVIVTTSGVNTATAVFALFALISLGTPRTGVLVALDRAEVPLVLPALLAAVAIAAVAGAILVPTLGDRYLRIVGRLDPTYLSLSVIAVLVGLSALFAGLVGVGAFGAATAGPPAPEVRSPASNPDGGRTRPAGVKVAPLAEMSEQDSDDDHHPNHRRG